MACPSGKKIIYFNQLKTLKSIFCIGCLNGGAQVRPKDGLNSKELILQLEEMYHSLPCKSLEDIKFIEELYKTWLGDEDSDKCNAILNTSYHAIEKNVNALNIKW